MGKNLITPTKERIMIISQNRGKVKKKALSLISQLKPDLSRPLLKFILEMCLGMLMLGSCNVNLIAEILKEQIDVKHTVKRLHRMLLNSRILELANKLSLKVLIGRIWNSTILALDGGGLSHQYGKKFEKSANAERFKIVDQLINHIGKLGLWVIDRGYDGGKMLKYFLGKGLNFMLRMNKSRNIIYKGKK